MSLDFGGFQSLYRGLLSHSISYGSGSCEKQSFFLSSFSFFGFRFFVKSSFSIISFYSSALKLNFGRKGISRYLSSSNSALSSFCAVGDSVTFEDYAATINDDCLDARYNSVKFEEKEYFGEEVSEGQKTDSSEMKMIQLILKNHRLDLDFGSRLKQLEIISILDILFAESLDAGLCLYYFKWTERFSGSNHSLQSVCRMIHILVSGNINHRAVDLMLNLVKNYSSQEDSYTMLLNSFYETHTERKVLETVCSMLVHCYIKERMVSLAVKLMCQMKHLGIFPSKWVYQSLIQASLELNQLESAWDLLEEMHNQGVSLNCSINLFIRHYCAEGSVNSGWKLLLETRNFGSKLDAVDYTIVIGSLCNLSLLKEAISLLFKMIEFGISPDSVTMSSVIDGCCKMGKLDEACKILKYFSLPPNIFVYNSFISKLCTDGNVVRASELFREISEAGLVPDCVSYTTMIGGCCKVGDINKAFVYLGKMLTSGKRLSVVTYTLFIDSLCKSGDMEMPELLLQKMISDGLKPDVVAYNTLMDGYAKKGYLHKAFRLLDMMRSENITPDVVTYNTLINGLITRGFLLEAKYILDELMRRGFSIDVITYTNFIDGFSKRGNFEEAFLVWFHMTENCVKPDVVTCSALLSGYCRERRMDEAIALFHKMLDIGLDPDLILYNTLIHGFCCIGYVDEACNLVKKMIESSILPNNVTHQALVLGFQKQRVIDPTERATFTLREILLAYGYL